MLAPAALAVLMLCRERLGCRLGGRGGWLCSVTSVCVWGGVTSRRHGLHMAWPSQEVCGSAVGGLSQPVGGLHAGPENVEWLLLHYSGGGRPDSLYNSQRAEGVLPITTGRCLRHSSPVHL